MPSFYFFSFTVILAAPMKYEGKGALGVATWSGGSGGQSSFPVLLLAGVYQS